MASRRQKSKGKPRPRAAGALPVCPRDEVGLPLAAALLAVVCVVVFWNSFRAELLLDNQIILLKDPRLRTADWPSARAIFAHHYWWPTVESQLYRPLTTLSYWFNFSLLGGAEHAGGYHAVNLLLHWLAAVLAFALVRALGARGFVALAAAALFAVHPLTVESVTNVVGRADILAALSVVGGLLLHRRALRGRGASRGAAGAGSPPGERRGRPHVGMALLGLGAVYAAGVFCKESAVVLPAAMLLHDAAFPAERGSSPIQTVRRSAARAWPSYVAVLPGLVALLCARWALFHDSPLFGELATDNPIVIAPFWTGVMTAIKAGGYSLALAVWPAALSCDYSYNAVTLFGGTFASGQDAHAWLSLGALLVLAALAVAAWRRCRPAWFLLGFAAVAFLPTSNLLFPIGALMAERFLYLPLVGLAGALLVAAEAGCTRLLEQRPAARRRSARILCVAGLLLVVAALAGRTIVRNADWSSAARLYATSAAAAPGSVKLISWMAYAAFQSEPTEAGAERAIDIARPGLRILEEAPLPLAHQPAAFFSDLGGYYLLEARAVADRGDGARAAALTRTALPLLERAAAIDRAFNREARQRRLARGADPASVRDGGAPRIHRVLGMTYLQVGEPAKAVEALSYLAHIAPADDGAWQAWGVAEAVLSEAEQGRADAQSAREHLERAAVRLAAATLLRPDNEEAWQALERVYLSLAVPPDAIVTSSGRRSLDLADAAARRHLEGACAELQKRFVEAGLAVGPDRWPQCRDSGR